MDQIEIVTSIFSNEKSIFHIECLVTIATTNPYTVYQFQFVSNAINVCLMMKRKLFVLFTKRLDLWFNSIAFWFKIQRYFFFLFFCWTTHVVGLPFKHLLSYPFEPSKIDVKYRTKSVKLVLYALFRFKQLILEKQFFLRALICEGVLFYEKIKSFFFYPFQ